MTRDKVVDANDIVIVRDGDQLRLLFGHLRLSNLMNSGDALFVDVPGEGSLRIQRTRKGFFAMKDNLAIPICLE